MYLLLVGILALKMQEDWPKERHALLKSIKEKEDRLKDFEKVRCLQHIHLFPVVKCAFRSDSTPPP